MYCDHEIYQIHHTYRILVLRILDCIVVILICVLFDINRVIF